MTIDRRGNNAMTRLRLCHIAPLVCRGGGIAVRRYMKTMLAGEEALPISVIKQRGRYRYRIFDGAHRARAARRIGRRTIQATIIADET